jgi:hypothetical protein
MEEKQGRYFVLFHLMGTWFKELLYVTNMGKHDKGRLHIS